MRMRASAVGAGLATLLAAACTSQSLVNVAPSSTLTDPAVVQTAQGAQGLYSFTIAQWALVVGGGGSNNAMIVQTGMFTDELMRVGNGFNSATFATDERFDRPDVVNVGSINRNNETALHGIRNNARTTRDALAAYAPSSPVAWRSRLLSLEGFAIVYIAEWYCSGVPLSKVPLSGPILYTRGFSTEEMLGQAVTLFDSALTLAGDSTRFRYLAAVGKGRALLDAGKFTEAAAAVHDVPTDFVYLLELSTTATNPPGTNPIGNRPQDVQTVDNEGTNGLVWSTDPRTAITTTPTISGAMKVPGKYSVTGGVVNATVSNPTAPVRAADGLEARLIEAEAALANNDPSWLTTLNSLRSNCVGSTPCAPVPGLTALPALADPGNANARLDLLMQERAMWLYLTGHRNGDLRRMAHLYSRDPKTLWPRGLYINPGFPPQVPATATNGITSYAENYVINTTTTFGDTGSGEIAFNTLYSGCLNLNP